MFIKSDLDGNYVLVIQLNNNFNHTYLFYVYMSIYKKIQIIETCNL